MRDELVKLGGDAAALADSPILFPTDEDAARLNVFATLPDDVDARLTERFLRDHRRLTMADDRRRQPTAASGRARRIPYVLIIPGIAFLFVFFVVPLITLFKISLSTKPDRLLPEYDFTWEWGNFGDAFTDFGEPSGAGVRLRRHRHGAVHR